MCKDLLKVSGINDCSYTNARFTSISVMDAVEFLDGGWCQDHWVQKVLEFHLNTLEGEK